MSKFTLVINAGGESRRMGQSKALLPILNTDGRPRSLIAHIAERLRPLSPERLVVVTNDGALIEQAQIAEPVEFIHDTYPGMGALGGIATALEAVDEWAILVACDMPLVNRQIFELMCEMVPSTTSLDTGDRVREGVRVRAESAIAPKMADHVDVIVPMVDGYAQTLHALYHRRCLPTIGEQLAAEERKITRFFSKVSVRKVTEDEIRPLDPEFRSFMNANTPEEWAWTLQYLDDGNGP